MTTYIGKKYILNTNKVEYRTDLDKNSEKFKKDLLFLTNISTTLGQKKERQK